MNKQQLLDFCQEVGQVEILKPKSVPNVRQDPDESNEVRIDDQWVTIDKQVNPSLGFKLKKINPHIEACQLGCGDIVEDQVIQYRMYAFDEGWRTRCVNCQKALDPDGNLVPGYAAPQAWATRRRQLKK
jgi:hypothetical protein